MRRAVIIVPTYNEEGTIESIIKEVFVQEKKVPNWEIHILVVDSRSQDKTESMVRQLQRIYPRLHLLSIAKEGLGKAYVQGFQYAIEKINPFVLFEMDADLSHDPKEIPVFLHAIEQGADFVVGSRYIKGGSIPQDWGIERKIYSIFANLFIRFGFMRLKITDWTNGYRAIKTWIVKDSLHHIQKYSGYVFQVALLDNAINHKARIYEIPIKFKDRTHGVSKINSFQYIVNTFWYVLSHSSFIKFVIVGFIGFAVDFGISYLLIDKAHWVIWQATLLSTESAIIFNFILNNFWSFSHKRLEHNPGVYAKSFLKFNFISSGSILIQVIGIQLLSNLFGRKLWLLYKVGIIAVIVIPYSYIFYNKFIWKNK